MYQPTKQEVNERWSLVLESLRESGRRLAYLASIVAVPFAIWYSFASGAPWREWALLAAAMWLLLLFTEAGRHGFLRIVVVGGLVFD